MATINIGYIIIKFTYRIKLINNQLTIIPTQSLGIQPQWKDALILSVDILIIHSTNH